MVEGNAEIAAAQQQELDISRDIARNARSELESAVIEAGDLRKFLVNMSGVIVSH